jgi:hypothetical protein
VSEWGVGVHPRIPLRNVYTKISVVNFGLIFLMNEGKKKPMAVNNL